MKWHTLLALGCAVTCAHAATPTREGHRVRTLVGESTPVCAETRSRLEDVPSEDFWNGNWRAAFASVDWQHTSAPIVTTSGTTEAIAFKHAEADVDGDGTADVVIVTSNMIRSVLFDWLYLLDKRTFRSAIDSGHVWTSINEAKQLNPSNYVTFSDGNIAIPVHLEIWKRDDASYLLLKEHNFARPNTSTTNQFVVATFQKPPALVPAARNGEKTLRPTMICQFVAEHAPDSADSSRPIESDRLPSSTASTAHGS